MEVVTGNTGLTQVYQNKHINHLKKRESFQDLIGYLHKDNDSQLCSLYGLRRTGKTTLMAQAAETLDPSTVIWIHCEIGDSMQDVKNAIQAHPSCQFIFIDEATRLENFIDTSSILADRYCAEQGKKIIIAGTDSLGIRFSLNRGLFDRTHVIHTTYIPFKEHRYLLGTSDIDKYIEYGGTLTNGKIFYNDDMSNDFDYTNSAIAINIQHSLEQLDDGGAFGPLLKFYAANELTTFINKIVEHANRTFLAATVNKMFKSHDLGKLRNNLERDKSVDIDVSGLKNKDLIEEIRKELLIKEPLTMTASKESIDAVKAYLQAMDVIYIVPESDGEEVIFTQPGLRYSQVQKLMHTLEHSPLMNEYSPSERKVFRKRLDETVKGDILEDILYYQLVRDVDFQKSYNVTKYRDPMGTHEIDLVILNTETDEAYLFEIKHTKEFCPANQARHLLDEETIKAIENKYHVTVAGKSVIYRGKDQYGPQGITYQNAATFLVNPQKSILQCKKNFQNPQPSSGPSPDHR